MKIRDDAGAWVDEEFETRDLGDPRRDRRAKELVKRFASWPTASISQSSRRTHTLARRKTKLLQVNED